MKEGVTEFCYNVNFDIDILNFRLGWVALEKLSHILHCQLHRAKKQAFNQCILSVMSFRAETWTLNNRPHQKSA